MKMARAIFIYTIACTRKSIYVYTSYKGVLCCLSLHSYLDFLAQSMSVRYISRESGLSIYGRRRRCARGTRRGDASATKAPASPAFPAVVTAAASAAASETSRRRRHVCSVHC
jgi:hypothetical protein